MIANTAIQCFRLLFQFWLIVFKALPLQEYFIITGLLPFLNTLKHSVADLEMLLPWLSLSHDFYYKIQYRFKRKCNRNVYCALK